MKPAPFEYIAPDSLAEVLELMSKYGYDAKLIAGGQSLVPAMNFRLVQPTMLVDMNKLTELNYIRITDVGGLLIGGMTRHRQLETEPMIKSKAPLINETMPYIAHLQIRNRGTIGGSLAHADPAAELPVIMVLLKSRIHVRSKESDRWIDADNFFRGIFTTDLADDEVIVEVEVPPYQSRTGCSFVEFSRRQGDFALLGAAASIRLDEAGSCESARIVYLNAGDRPFVSEEVQDYLVGEQPTAKLLEQASAAASKDIDPTGDIHASVPYLRHLARVLTNQVLFRAVERAQRHL